MIFNHLLIIPNYNTIQIIQPKYIHKSLTKLNQKSKHFSWSILPYLNSNLQNYFKFNSNSSLRAGNNHLKRLKLIIPSQ